MTASALAACLARVHDELRGVTEGEVASYIPELLRVEADRFGLALVTLDGHVLGAGDDEHEFTIQSISKPFVYGIALDDHGVEHVSARVGVEPSGEAFNSIVMDEVHNRPPNPMVNAGAIACAAMVRGDGLAGRSAHVLETLGRYAGRELSIDWDVAESERRTGHRNRAIAYLELSAGMIEEPVEEHLDLYVQQCSVRVTARDLAMMAATLANGGVNPVTGVRALRAEHVSKVLSVMATCGMYDWSGEWMFRIGLPAKSGVGGGIIAVLPGQVGIGTFSPRLDPHGNSCRGVRACEELAGELGLHLLDATATPSVVVGRRYSAAAVSSKRVRRAAERAVLEASGPAVTVLQLQGDLYFATAERLVRTIEACATEARVVILDARRVGRATTGALGLLGEVHRNVTAAGVELVLAAAPPALAGALAAPDVGWTLDDMVVDVDHALERGEDLVLAEHRGRDPVGAAEVDLHDVDVLADLDAEALAVIVDRLDTTVYAAGEQILREGDPARRLCYLTAGRATLVIGMDDGTGRTKRLRSFGPGTVFGEAAALQGASRSASVFADEPSVVRSLTTDVLAELATSHPAAHAELLTALGRNLAALLARAVAEFRVLDE